jgi:hypothetical protein
MPRTKRQTDRAVAELLAERVFSLSDEIRSVAVSYRGRLATVSRPISGGPEWWDADKYEEVIVNPTLMTLLRQRGNIDCGGFEHVVVQYGDFTQLVHPIDGGHLSVGFARTKEYRRLLSRVRKLLRDEGLIAEHHTP